MNDPRLSLQIPVIPDLDPDFLPAVLWNRSFRALAEAQGSRPLAIALERGDGAVSVFRTVLLPDAEANRALNARYGERLLKFLLWQKGGWRVLIGGAPELAAHLGRSYSPEGARAFDHRFMGEKLFGNALEIRSVPLSGIPEERETASPLGGHLEGCRIGFDLGGSDRKAAALIDGKVVYSEEIAWDPYFQSDPDYHFQGIRDSLRRAADHLPRVDAIGGSAAGVYVNNQVRAASLFRGVPEDAFRAQVQRLFFRVMEAEGWADVPWEVVNDGEVTALAGALSLHADSILGISMGTSLAAGYVDPQGNIRPWLNELAFAPVDYREDAPADEWSGDLGCGVQYFSQQAVARLAPAAGLSFADSLPLPERLVAVQDRLAAGDARAARIYATIGTCFGYAIAHYAEFYTLRHLLVLGRVTSGEGGEILLREARSVLDQVFPDLSSRVTLRTPDEKEKRHGQAIAAASLPALRPGAAPAQ